MSERLPYEEQFSKQWENLPLPDENAAWDNMKLRLQKDNDDRVIPFWLSGCGLWGLIGLLVIGLGWWFVRPDKWLSKKQDANVSIDSIATDANKHRDNRTTYTTVTSGTEKKVVGGDTSTTNTTNMTVLPGNEMQEENNNPRLPSKEKQEETNKPASIEKQKPAGTSSQRSRGVIPAGTTQKKKKPQQNILQPVNPSQKKIDKQVPVEPKKKPDEPPFTRDTIAAPKAVVPPKDSTSKKTRDSLNKTQQKDFAGDTKKKKDSSDKKTISFAAGLGVHQLIPIDGQELTPYDAEGRKGSLYDYIPSLYMRMYKADKWFLQAEFRYGAPQSVPEMLYDKHVVDSFNSFTTVKSTTLKKTFYHQLPVTFNYFVTKDFSVGGGIVWNKFTSAVTESDVSRRNNITQTDSIISKGVIETQKADSASQFAKSYLQALFEAEYRWKRFSFGLKYSFGLEPYITFTLPGGTQQQEKNKSLQLFVRYELWRSKKK
jgi:hypothetical protein